MPPLSFGLMMNTPMDRPPSLALVGRLAEDLLVVDAVQVEVVDVVDTQGRHRGLELLHEGVVRVPRASLGGEVDIAAVNSLEGVTEQLLAGAIASGCFEMVDPCLDRPVDHGCTHVRVVAHVAHQAERKDGDPHLGSAETTVLHAASIAVI